VESVLLKVLARKPGDRYPDMQSFTNELQDLLDGREVDAAAIKTTLLREQMTGNADGQPRSDKNKVERIPVEQSRSAVSVPAPVKTQRGNRFWVVAGSVSAGLCICLALASVGFMVMNGLGSATTSPSADSVPSPQSKNTVTPTSTVVMLPPVTVSGCTSADDCPDTVWIADLSGENGTQEDKTEYSISISQDKKVRFFSGWCAIDRKTLDENLTKMEIAFTIDGKSHVDKLKKEYFEQQSDTDSTEKMSCYGVGGVISDWQKSHTYRVEIGPVFNKQVFDGWDTFPQGKQLSIYLITVK
jgi:hypothetical protein